jgi:hypothetical protein
LRTSGIIDQNVDAAEAVDRTVGDAFGAAFYCEVTENYGCLTALLPNAACHGERMLFASPMNDNGCPFCSQSVRDGFSDAHAAPGYQRALAA